MPSTCVATATPAHHRFVLNADANWFQPEAEKIGAHTAAYFSVLLKSRAFPQQAYRTCLGILDLARKHAHARLEIVCERLLPAHWLSYKDVKAELERLAVNLPAEPLPVHENVRGQSYYH